MTLHIHCCLECLPLQAALVWGELVGRQVEHHWGLDPETSQTGVALQREKSTIILLKQCSVNDGNVVRTLDLRVNSSSCDQSHCSLKQSCKLITVFTSNPDQMVAFGTFLTKT